ncbi:Ig-like domain repeat protein [Psychrobacillus sp. FSL K6-1415]|uniref:Ig-like domain repeat protein n=1 Tax=Psychrobacillus sp. FSL K6-1415 TaxID=2921544 RepID=UPI0030F6970A
MSNENLLIEVEIEEKSNDKPRTVVVGESIKFRANIKDDSSGVKTVSISFKNPSNSRTQHVPLSQKSPSKIWEGTYKIQSTDEAGKYDEFFINVTDNAGNKIYGWDVLNHFKDKMIFFVENSQGGDINPPTLISAKINPATVTVGESLAFTLSAGDDLSGVKSIAISFKNPSGSKTEHVPLRFDESSNNWTGTYKVLATDEGGEYKDLFISLSDNAGNRTYGWNLAEEFRNDIIFNIENSEGGDINPPKLKDAEVSPKSVQVGETLTFILNAEDDLSGVKSISLSFKNPSNTRTEHVPLQFDTGIGKWKGIHTVSSTDEGGEYKEFFITLGDKAGNRTYGWNLADEFGEVMNFVIKNSSGDITAPEIKNVNTQTNNKGKKP